ncbi:hypothetical protein AB0K51_19965 [Kitasatospora sp. NPDC049285]|uniref:hypothetical protein n=1 Tax=Kitasatospora sp. NPDC049285 TaxID=3157096 RepID=UPI00341EB0B3
MPQPDPAEAAATDRDDAPGTTADRAADGRPPAAPAMTLAEQEALRRKLQDKFH